jgi:hypothetical protein
MGVYDDRFSRPVRHDDCRVHDRSVSHWFDQKVRVNFWRGDVCRVDNNVRFKRRHWGHRRWLDIDINGHMYRSASIGAMPHMYVRVEVNRSVIDKSWCNFNRGLNDSSEVATSLKACRRKI